MVSITMRPVSELSSSADDPLDRFFEDTVLDFIDSETETNAQYESASSTENNMAAVFPNLAMSEIGVTNISKLVTVTKPHLKLNQTDDFTDATHSTSKSNTSVKEPPVLKETSEIKQCDAHKTNNNNIPSREILQDEAYGGLKGNVGLKEFGHEVPTSECFRNTVVEVLVEKTKHGAIVKSGLKGVLDTRNLSDDSDKENGLNVDCSDNKIFDKNAYMLTVSDDKKWTTQGVGTQECSSLAKSFPGTQAPIESISEALATRGCLSDSTSSSVKEGSLSQNRTLNEDRVILDGCPALSWEGAESLSPMVDFQTTNNCYDKQLALRNASQLPDDAITTESASETPGSSKLTRAASVGQDGAGEGRQRLPQRISKRLVNFFQKRLAKKPVLSDSGSSERHGRTPKMAAEKTHTKDATRQSSFVGKLKTSVAEWKCKHPNRVKNFSRDGKGTGSDTENKNEGQYKTKGRVPLFVSPQDQIEIVEDAPEGILEHQKAILRESWSVIKSDVAEVGVETFIGLFHTHPDSIDSFLAYKDKAIDDIEQGAVLKAHALRVMQTVDKCITRLDDTDKMAAVLFLLGRRHIGYRANACLVPMIGRQFISAIEPKMADNWSVDLHGAWDALFRVINYNLRQGMMQEILRLREEGVIKRRK